MTQQLFDSTEAIVTELDISHLVIEDNTLFSLFRRPVRSALKKFFLKENGKTFLSEMLIFS